MEARAPGDARREQLLEIGIEEFAAHGYDGVSIATVASRAGVAQGLLYHYFPSKRDFFVEVVRRIGDEMERATDADPALPAEQRLLLGLRANIDYAERHAGAFRTILRGGGSGDSEVRAIVERRRRRGVDRVLDGLGVAEPRPALVIAIRGWIGFFEEATLSWLDRRELTADQLLELLVAALRSALRDARAIDPEVELPAGAGRG